MNITGHFQSSHTFWPFSVWLVDKDLKLTQIQTDSLINHSDFLVNLFHLKELNQKNDSLSTDLKSHDFYLRLYQFINLN